jgi:hypothetical protein
MNYYNFLISTSDNKLKIAKIRSEDGTAAGTGLVNQSGESIHPSIDTFISQAGITADPPTGKVPFSYLNNYISTAGCTQVQTTFTASQHDLSFLPAKIKSLYEPQVTSNKLQFVTPNSKTVILEDRPGRIIDYVFPDQGSVGENYDYDDVVEICKPEVTHTKCDYTVQVLMYPKDCSPSFSLTIRKNVVERCVCISEIPKDSCTKFPGSDEYNFAEFSDRLRIDKFEEGDSYKQGECKESNTFAQLLISWGHKSGADPVKNYDPKPDSVGSGKVSTPDTITDDGGLGLVLAEVGIVLGATVANAMVNPLGFVGQSVAGGVAVAGAEKGGIAGNVAKTAGSVVANPVSLIATFAFDFLKDAVTEKLEDTLNAVSSELKKIQNKCRTSSKSDSECSTCLMKSFKDELKNKNSQLSRLISKIISNSGIKVCC